MAIERAAPAMLVAPTATYDPLDLEELGIDRRAQAISAVSIQDCLHHHRCALGISPPNRDREDHPLPGLINPLSSRSYTAHGQVRVRPFAEGLEQLREQRTAADAQDEALQRPAQLGRCRRCHVPACRRRNVADATSREALYSSKR